LISARDALFTQRSTKSNEDVAAEWWIAISARDVIQTGEAALFSASPREYVFCI